MLRNGCCVGEPREGEARWGFPAGQAAQLPSLCLLICRMRLLIGSVSRFLSMGVMQVKWAQSLARALSWKQLFTSANTVVATGRKCRYERGLTTIQGSLCMTYSHKEGMVRDAQSRDGQGWFLRSGPSLWSLRPFWQPSSLLYLGVDAVRPAEWLLLSRMLMGNG